MTAAAARNWQMRQRLAGLCIDCLYEPARDDALHGPKCSARRQASERAHYLRTRKPGVRTCGICKRVGHLRGTCPRREKR